MALIETLKQLLYCFISVLNATLFNWFKIFDTWDLVVFIHLYRSIFSSFSTKTGAQVSPGETLNKMKILPCEISVFLFIFYLLTRVKI